MSHIQPKQFTQAWTLQDASEYAALHQRRESADPQERQALQEACRAASERVEDALLSHMAYLAQQGRLGPVPHLEGTHVRWFRNWEALREGVLDEDALDSPRGMGFEKNVFMRLGFRCETPEQVATAYDKLVEEMDAGNFSEYGVEELGECQLTGERFQVRLNNWQPQPGRIMKVEGARFGVGFVPLEGGKFKEPGVEHLVVPLPSGELLIDDWFRIEEFTALTDEAAGGRFAFNINAIQGSVDQTRCYADKLGFASVMVGGTRPQVVLQDGSITIGRLPYDEEEDDYPAPQGRLLGCVDTELRWATLIDRQVLTDLVAQKVSRAEAARKVAALLDERKNTTTIVHLPPGEYHLYFAGHRQVFKECFASREVSMVSFEEPMLVLSPEPLTLLESKPRRKPRSP